MSQEVRRSSLETDNVSRFLHRLLLHVKRIRLTLEVASRKKATVNMSFSTQSFIISPGSPATGKKSMPCDLIQGSNSACVAIVGLCPSARNPLHKAMYG